MRKAFAHESLVVMGADADSRALGAAVTKELCGHWDHEPPCPVAPHHTSAHRSGEDVRVRTLFAVEPAGECGVRQGIERALERGHLLGPDGVESRWELVTTAAALSPRRRPSTLGAWSGPESPAAVLYRAS